MLPTIEEVSVRSQQRKSNHAPYSVLFPNGQNVDIDLTVSRPWQNLFMQTIMVVGKQEPIYDKQGIPTDKPPRLRNCFTLHSFLKRIQPETGTKIIPA